MPDSTVTITLGDVAENNPHNQQLGEMANEGFTPDDLRSYKDMSEGAGYVAEYINLNSYLPEGVIAEEAAVLIIRNGAQMFLQDVGWTADHLFAEQSGLVPDTKYYDVRRGKVLNKQARHNLCFDDQGQVADYESGKGTVVAFRDVPVLEKFRANLGYCLGPKAENLKAEGNYYYDIKKCGIGFHGDAERKKVIAVRLNHTIPLHYQWFHRYKPIGRRVELSINHGDVYIMSEKATGYDWQRSSLITLRHAAGAPKYLTIKEKA